MAGFASLFTDFDMFKIYLKKLFLLANSVAFHIHRDLTWCGSDPLCQISLYFKKRKRKKKANYEKWPNPRFSFDGGFVTKKRTNFNW